MSRESAGLHTSWPGLLLVALSLSIGWGIRGNFGHEYGAMIPGALAAVAACLISGREDWHRRVHHFAFFGALGWSFGGSMSYGHVLGYAHSGVLTSVVYGLACLFVIGFLWGAVGGAGTVLPACLNRERLTGLYVPILAVFAAWVLQDIVIWYAGLETSDLRHESPLYWYDTDWLGALLAAAAALAVSAVQRRIRHGSRLVLYMALGWWAGFLLLVCVLGLRMSPPRGDNWAGILGMTAGMLVFLIRNDLRPVACASILAGTVGGVGFSLATAIKIVAIKSGCQTNWHSVMEQTYGFINGIGIALAVLWLALRLPRLGEEPPIRRWTDGAAVFFVLVAITYLNISKNPEEWVKAGAMPAAMYGLSAWGWLNIGYALLAAAGAWLLARHLREPLPFVPASWVGRGQLLYLAFLWWMVLGNFERALPGFHPSRLITEGVIHVNAVLCTLLILLTRTRPAPPIEHADRAAGLPCLRLVGLLGLAFLAAVAVETAAVRLVWGDEPAQANRQVRFGPLRTATHEPPARGRAHP